MEKSIVEAIKELNEKGYSVDFSRNPWKDRLKLNITQFSIDGTYRFDGMTDPDDEAILFAISSNDGKIKGYLLNGYGPYSEDWINELISKIRIRREP